MTCYAPVFQFMRLIRFNFLREIKKYIKEISKLLRQVSLIMFLYVVILRYCYYITLYGYLSVLEKLGKQCFKQFKKYYSIGTWTIERSNERNCSTFIGNEKRYQVIFQIIYFSILFCTESN